MTLSILSKPTLDALLLQTVTDLDTLLILADWFEEAGEDQRAQLLRLQHRLFSKGPSDSRDLKTQEAIQGLLAAGTLPISSTFLGPYEIEMVRVPNWGWKGKPFGLGRFPITQEQYEAAIGSNPSHFKEVGGQDTRSFPVENVSWNEAASFCRRLTATPPDSPSRIVYRLPTEAEWEYACRAGTTTEFYFGDSLSSSQANFDGNYPHGRAKGDYLQWTSAVGSYQPNAWGLYDMHGNVWEWCEDLYTHEASARVLRGGSWLNYGRDCRSAYRYGNEPDNRNHNIGFRLAATIEEIER